MSKKNCMFQYATSHRWLGTDIYENTGLITFDEAKELWNKYLPKFIGELMQKDEGESPEMVIWTNCDNETNYNTDYAHLDSDSETDGVRVWNVVKTEVIV